MNPMKALELFRSREVFGCGVIEIVLWRVPRPVSPSEHPYKYRLVFLVDGRRVLGYDNERGKGNHKHFHSRESSYDFTSPARLLADFMKDIKEYCDV